MASKPDYDNLLSKLDQYLEGKYGKVEGSSKITLTRPELELALSAQNRESDFVEYLLGVIDGAVPSSAESSVSESPVKFVYAFTEFISKFIDTKANTHTRDLRKHFYEACMRDFELRPESALINREQSSLLSQAERKFTKNQDKSRRIKAIDAMAVGNSLSRRVLVEHNNANTKIRDRSYLIALDSFIYYSRFQNSFESSSIEQLLCLYEDLQDQLAAQDKQRTGSDIFAGQLLASQEISSQIESALVQKLEEAQGSEFSEGWVQRIKTLNRGRGAKPESFGLRALSVLSHVYNQEAADSEWWAPLSLAELLIVIQENRNLEGAVVQSANQSNWLRQAVDRHVAESDSLQHLTLAFQANIIFGTPESRDLIRIWKSALGKSNELQEIQKALIDGPVENMRISGDKREKDLAASYQTELDSLNTEIANLQAAIATLEATMERGKENLGDTKAGLETGISRKYGEAIARIIRRMEREAGKNPFQDIISKESSGLSRLGISLLISGSTQAFNPAMHDSVGQNLELGANVTIIETGVLLLLGKDTITLLKAVVRPAE